MEQGTGSAAYIDSIMGQLKMCDEPIATGLPYLDAYLTQKVPALGRMGVNCHIALSLTPLSHIAPIDMIPIIGNSVDNAGKAFQRLPKDQRLLMVKSSSFANTILLQFINPFDCQRQSEILKMLSRGVLRIPKKYSGCFFNVLSR